MLNATMREYVKKEFANALKDLQMIFVLSSGNPRALP